MIYLTCVLYKRPYEIFPVSLCIPVRVKSTQFMVLDDDGLGNVRYRYGKRVTRMLYVVRVRVKVGRVLRPR